MIEAAVRIALHADLLDDYLGPAEVLAGDSARVHARVGDVACEARVALAFPYEPSPGDVVLLVARRGDAYVIGLLEGRGKIELAIAGDVALRAVGGVLRLEGDKGVRVTAPEIDLVASKKLRLVAEAASQTFSTLARRVRGLFTSNEGERLAVVENNRVDKAKNATILTEETMSINGKQIHLG